jgi:hypothetical protein
MFIYWNTGEYTKTILALQPTLKILEDIFSKERHTIPYYRPSQNRSTSGNQILVNSGFNLGICQ